MIKSRMTLRQARLHKGWTQDALARRAGISRTSVLQLEKREAKGSATPRKISKLAEVMNYDIEVSVLVPTLTNQPVGLEGEQ